MQQSTKDVAIFLFDISGKMAQPWLSAGYTCYTVDIQHPVAYATGGITQEGNLFKVHADLTIPWLCPVDRNRIAFVAAFPPCDHLSVAGARWFKGKGLRMLELSISMFATAVEFCEWAGAPYFLENPVSNISSHWRKPDLTFQPYEYTNIAPEDNYTKKTCLWIGNGFVMPEADTHPKVLQAINYVVTERGRLISKREALKQWPDSDLIEGYYPDNRIHDCPPGPDRHNIRSATPIGFAIAVFEANKSVRN